MWNAEYRLAALPFIAATRFHLALLIRLLEFALRHLAFVLCHLAFAICHLTFPIPRSEFPIPHSSEAFPASAAAPASWPTGSVGAARTPRCDPAPRGRPKWGPRSLRWPGVLGQQLLEPADVLCDDRGEHRPRLHRIPGSGSNLTPLQPVVIGGIGNRLLILERFPFHALSSRVRSRTARRTRWAKWDMPMRSARSMSRVSRAAWAVRSRSMAFCGCTSSIHSWVRPSSRLGFSWDKVGMMVKVAKPCLRSLRRTRALPPLVFGPVLLCELRRLASICAAVAMGGNFPMRVNQFDAGMEPRWPGSSPGGRCFYPI